MNNNLTVKNWFDPVADFFKDQRFLKGFDHEISRILNGKSDFEETPDNYILELEVPGIKKEEIKIELKDDVLTVRWNRSKENKSVFGKSSYERSEGEFIRKYGVEGADPDKIEAELKNGVLKITVAKREESKAREIQIN